MQLKNDVVKKDIYNAKVKNIEDKIPDITNLVNNTTYNPKINKVKGEVLSITNLATTSALNPILDGGEGRGRAKRSSVPVFFSVTSTNVGISPQNFQTFSFNPFATLV